MSATTSATAIRTPFDPQRLTVNHLGHIFTVPVLARGGLRLKPHGLVEFEATSWQSKTLADLWLIQSRIPLDVRKLRTSIEIAFQSRDALVRLHRLLA
ncbi:MAG: hypothetical protein R3C05_19380 [Pirellulaceae bacterium]